LFHSISFFSPHKIRKIFGKKKNFALLLREICLRVPFARLRVSEKAALFSLIATTFVILPPNCFV